MPGPSLSSERSDAALHVFEAELALSLPFREDRALLAALMVEVSPVLSALGEGHRAASQDPCRGPGRAALSEGFALFNLLCRRAGLLGATPSASLALARAMVAALKREGLALSPGCGDDLALIAVEGFSAGRDELRERSLRTIALESQVLIALAPRCFCLFLAGSLLSDPLERLLEDYARQLFRAEARSVLLDSSRLCECGEDQARVLVAFASTLTGLGIEVLICESTPRFDGWFEKLGLTLRGVSRCTELGDALTRTLAAGGYELRTRSRLGELLGKVRTSAR